MRLFHWGVLLRAMVYGVFPLLGGWILLERWMGPGVSGAAMVGLALLLPFVAVGWLGYQHFRHRKR
jgi:xanthine/uracil permease